MNRPGQPDFRHLIAEMVERMPGAVLVIIAAGRNVHAGEPTEFLAAHDVG
ncbi:MULTISPECIES: hypothetical protein [unclassified Microbispora]|nr:MULTISPECIES: hypothetical protein [unclassified Microbispora]